MVYSPVSCHPDHGILLWVRITLVLAIEWQKTGEYLVVK